MLRRSSILVPLLLGYAHNATASSKMASFDAAPNFAPRSIVFDDPVGKASSWSKALPCGANRATVTVKFDNAYQSGGWAPVAKVRLRSGKPGDVADASETAVAAVVVAPTDAYRLNASVWIEKAQGDTDGQGYAPADLSKPLQIDFAWTPDGEVTVDFGGEFEKHTSIGKPVASIEVALSWAKFEFIDLKVGHSGPPDPTCSSS